MRALRMAPPASKPELSCSLLLAQQLLTQSGQLVGIGERAGGLGLGRVVRGFLDLLFVGRVLAVLGGRSLGVLEFLRDEFLVLTHRS